MKLSIAITAALLIAFLIVYPSQTIAVLGIALLACMSCAGRVP